MNLADFYHTEGAAFLNRLHQDTGISRPYLYQLATGVRCPSPRMAWRLIEAEPRLTIDEIFAKQKKTS